MPLLAGKRSSAASVIAIAALVCAMSGSAVAASTALHNGDKLIAKNSLSGNRLRTHTVTATQIKQPVWHAMTLETGWAPYDATNYGTPAYAIDDEGFIHLRGAIKDVSASSGTFTQLPVGFRPSETYDFVPAASTDSKSNPQTVVLVVQNTGFITANAAPPGTLDFVSLAGVSFAG